MNRPLGVSLAGNLVLGLTLVLLWWQPGPAGSPIPPLAAPRRGPGLTAAPASGAPDFRAAGQPRLPWDRIASANLALFRDNLRAVGCPEATIRDILSAELVESAFRRDRTTIEALEPQYWEQIARGDVPFESWGGSVAERDWEPELVRLLGPDRESAETPLKRALANRRRSDSWLPQDVQDRLLELEAARWKTNAARRAANPGDWVDFHVQLQRDNDDFEARRRAVLGDYWAEYQLRNSTSASWAANLPGFEATEAEWRAVAEALEALGPRPALMMDPRMLMRYGLLPKGFKIVVPGTEPTAGPGPDPAALVAENTPASGPSPADWTNRRAAVFRETLGPARHAEFTRAQDSAYQQVYRVTQRLGLPETAAAQAWELRRAAEANLVELESQTAADRVAVETAVRQVLDETTRALEMLLGATGLAAYREYAGAWLFNRAHSPRALLE